MGAGAGACPAVQSRCWCAAIFSYCSFAGLSAAAAFLSYSTASAQAFATASGAIGGAVTTGASIGEQAISCLPETLQTNERPRQSACHEVVDELTSCWLEMPTSFCGQPIEPAERAWSDSMLG